MEMLKVIDIIQNQYNVIIKEVGIDGYNRLVLVTVSNDIVTYGSDKSVRFWNYKDWENKEYFVLNSENLENLYYEFMPYIGSRLILIDKDAIKYYSTKGKCWEELKLE